MWHLYIKSNPIGGNWYWVSLQTFTENKRNCKRKYSYRKQGLAKRILKFILLTCECQSHVMLTVMLMKFNIMLSIYSLVNIMLSIYSPVNIMLVKLFFRTAIACSWMWSWSLNTFSQKCPMPEMLMFATNLLTIIFSPIPSHMHNTRHGTNSHFSTPFFNHSNIKKC